MQSQPTGTAKDGTVVVARLDDGVTRKRVVRLDKRRVELRPESRNPDHKPTEVELEAKGSTIARVAVGTLIGDGFNGSEYEHWGQESAQRVGQSRREPNRRGACGSLVGGQVNGTRDGPSTS